MVKLRMQGTPQEIQRLLEILSEEKRIMVFDPSAAFDIKGTNRYKRVFAELYLSSEEYKKLEKQ